MRIIVAIALLLAALVGPAFAADEKAVSPPQVVVSSFVAPPFAPSEAIFLLQEGKRPLRRLKGLFVPRIRQEQNNDLPKGWLVGVRIDPPAKELLFSILIRGAQNELYFVPPQSFNADDPNSAETIRANLMKRKEALRSFGLQIKTQGESLNRLKADAEVIANVGRIVEVKEETQRVSADIARLDKDIENLNAFIRLAKSHPPVKNFAARESDLVGQLAELVGVVKTVESQEISRKSRAETELQHQLSIVEQTRFENLDALQQELTTVRRRRLQLEREEGKGEGKSETPST